MGDWNEITGVLSHKTGSTPVLQGSRLSPFTSLKWQGLLTARYLSIVEAITKKMEQHMLILSSVKEIKMQ